MNELFKKIENEINFKLIKSLQWECIYNATNDKTFYVAKLKNHIYLSCNYSFKYDFWFLSLCENVRKESGYVEYRYFNDKEVAIHHLTEHFLVIDTFDNIDYKNVNVYKIILQSIKQRKESDLNNIYNNFKDINKTIKEVTKE